jgi:ATP-dependent Clp protease ATP-binding subunit ClpX
VNGEQLREKLFEMVPGARSQFEKIIPVKASYFSMSPKDFYVHLNNKVVGQEEAKKRISITVFEHLRNLSQENINDKFNILLLGPSGSGKTLIINSIAEKLNVPYASGDATGYSPTGFQGADVDSVIHDLYMKSNGNIQETQKGVVFIDEIDKISRRSESASITRDVSGEGVQQALLKLVEGTKCRVTPTGNRKHPSGDMIEIDTTNILFIAGGAFVGLDNVVKNRVRGTSIGFGAQVTSDTNTHLDQTTPEDLIKFGMIPEFVGRFPSWVALQELDKEDLIRILLDVKHSYIAQYSWLFEQDQVELEFSPEALEMIADRTILNKTGARGLHSELERVLLPHMFYLASYRREGVNRVFIDADQVNTPTELKEANGKAKG